jgi:hypothetical protein
MANHKLHNSNGPTLVGPGAGVKIYGRFRYVFSLLLTLQLFLSGCVTLRDPEASQEYRGDVVAVVGPERVVGQSFVSRRPGLNGIQLWLRIKPNFSHDDSLVAELYHAPAGTPLLETITVPYSSLTNAFPLTISFSPRSDPPQQAYYLALRTSGGEIEIFGRNEDAYPDGELFEAAAPRQADASFRTSYDYNPVAILNDLGKALANIWLVIPLAV